MSSAKRIQLASPKAGYLACKEAIQAAVLQVLDSGWYILGTEVERFEKEFAAYLGSATAVGVGSGTEAVHLALRACGIEPGDGVVTVAHTAVATVAAIHLAGAVPIVVDVEANSHTMDPGHLELALKKSGGTRIRAVIPVHLYGHPAPMPALLEIARRHGLKVIEDCAQSHGARIGSRTTGTFGDIGAFSFYPTKNLGALGDGGACVSSNSELDARLRLLRQYGWRERYISEIPGLNTRLDELQAAILCVKLPFLKAANERRRQIAATYGARLKETGLILPSERPETTHVYHQYVVRTPKREALRAFLEQKGIATGVLYPVPIHLQPAYVGKIQIGPGGLSVTEGLCKEILSLPLYPELTDAEVDHVCRMIVEFTHPRGLH